MKCQTTQSRGELPVRTFKIKAPLKRLVTEFRVILCGRVCVLCFMFVRITVVDITDVVVSDVELYEVIDKLSFDIFVLLVFFFTVLFG